MTCFYKSYLGEGIGRGWGVGNKPLVGESTGGRGSLQGEWRSLWLVGGTYPVIPVGLNFALKEMQEPE